MARFDVYRSRDSKIYLLDCQADTLDYFHTRFVIPLVPEGAARKTGRLHPDFEIQGKSFIMATQLASAISVRELGEKITNLSSQHIPIMDALDMLMAGY